MNPVNYVAYERDGFTNQNGHVDLMEWVEEYSVNEATQEIILCDFP